MSGSYDNTNGRTESLNAGAAHDNGLYDPNRHDNQIVAVYESNAQAASARESLVGAGIPESAIRVVDRSDAGTMGGTTAEDRSDGFWGAIKSLFAPEEDQTAYHHAVDRGHTMLVLTPNASMDRSRAIQVLEDTNPIDFDAKLEEWRQAGYDYSSRPGSAPGAGANAGAGVGAIGAATGMAASGTEMAGLGTGTSGSLFNAGSNAASEGSPRSTQTLSGQTDTGYRSDMAGSTGSHMGSAAETAGTRTDASTSSSMGTGMGAGTGSGMGASTGTSMRAGVNTGTSNADTIKVVEERLRVGKREVAQGAVRVRSYVVERPVEEQVRLHEERISVERHPVDRAATPGDAGAFQERTIEARATSEEPVVNKTARVVEEIGIHKDVSDRTETVRDTVRKTEVDVEDTTGSGVTGGLSGGSAGTGASPTATPGATSSGMNSPRK